MLSPRRPTTWTTQSSAAFSSTSGTRRCTPPQPAASRPTSRSGACRYVYALSRKGHRQGHRVTGTQGHTHLVMAVCHRRRVEWVGGGFVGFMCRCPSCHLRCHRAIEVVVLAHSPPYPPLVLDSDPTHTLHTHAFHSGRTNPLTPLSPHSPTPSNSSPRRCARCALLFPNWPSPIPLTHFPLHVHIRSIKRPCNEKRVQEIVKQKMRSPEWMGCRC